MRRLPLILTSLVLVLAALLVWTVRPSFKRDPAPVLVKISRGASAHHIAKALHEKGVIRSAGFFLALAMGTGQSGQFRYGIYELERNHYWAALRKIVRGDTYKLKVSIPEGWTSHQIAEKLVEKGILAEKDPFVRIVAEKELEGRLFPETYFLEPDMEPERAVDAMVRQFRKNYGEDFTSRAESLGLTEREVITMASIIEREAQVGSERPIISSVYHNRLKRGWLLEADPTVQYALSNGRSWKERMTYKDLKIDSPYNTYRYKGLPPGPICNPGAESLKAALYPSDTPYLYFVADGSGAHKFSTKYKKHLQYKRELRKRRR